MAARSQLKRCVAFVALVALLFTVASAWSDCPDGQRVTLSGTCEPCEANQCKKCWLSKGSCQECNDGFYLALDGTCVPCPGANCLTCASLTGTCTACPKGYKFIPPGVGIYYPATSTGYCESNYSAPTFGCPDGNHINLDGTCSPCETTNCKKCYVSTLFCSTCNSGYYMTLGGTCEPCPGRNCKNCGDLTGICLSCPSGMKYHPPNLGLFQNASKYGYCDGASIVQQFVVAVAVTVSFVLYALSA